MTTAAPAPPVPDHDGPDLSDRMDSTPGVTARTDQALEPLPPVRRWWLGVGVVTLLAAGIRVATVLGRPDRVPGGDPFSFHYGANLLADGLGFINPWLYYGHDLHLRFQSAQYPPLWTMLISVAAVTGFKSFFAQRIWACIIGSMVVPVAAVLGRDLLGGRTGRRVGWLAGVIVAVYPNIWMSNEQLMSETISPILAGLVLIVAYRFWRRPSSMTALGLGLVLGLAAMGRDEMSLLALLVIPLALFSRKLRWPGRLGRTALAGLGFVLLVGPWVGFNFARFDRPVFISTGLGNTLASANCPTTYSGSKAGYWSLDCALAAPHDPYQNEALSASEAQSYALTFIRSHVGDLPRVLFDREGRTWGFWQPTLQIRDDATVETRPFHWAEIGLWGYYVLLALSVPGFLALRRHGVPIYPLLAIGLDVAVATALTLGQTRYRSAFELCLAVAGAIGADTVARAAWTHRPGGDSRVVFSRRTGTP